MPPRFQQILLWLFVLNLGIVFGAGVYESRIVLPQWLVTLPSGASEWRADIAREMQVGMRFWAFVSTGPLTLITIANLFAARKQSGRLRRFWLGSTLVTLIERVFTFAYFIPTMITLMESTPAPAEAVRIAEQWAMLNHLRHALVALAWLCALQSFGLWYARRPGPVATASDAPHPHGRR